MKNNIVINFIGGYWDGKTFRTDSPDYDEQLLAAGCYEMSHHGAIGGECSPLSGETMEYARRHGYEATAEATLTEGHRYTVIERRETAAEICITFKCQEIKDS